jgi:hypothetical protein
MKPSVQKVINTTVNDIQRTINATNMTSLGKYITIEELVADMRRHIHNINHRANRKKKEDI